MRRLTVAHQEARTVLKHALNLVGSSGLLIVSLIQSIWWLTAFSLLAIAWSLMHFRRAFRSS